MPRAWLVENDKSGDQKRYRTIRQGCPAWTSDRKEAIWFSRRADAEMFSEEDEDAWFIKEYSFETPFETLRWVAEIAIISYFAAWAIFLLIFGGEIH